MDLTDQARPVSIRQAPSHRRSPVSRLTSGSGHTVTCNARSGTYSRIGAGNSTVNPTGAITVPILAFPNLSGRSPYYMNWSFGFQRQLPGNFVFGITYSASAARFLSRYTAVGKYTNSMDPKYLVLGSLLNAQATPANVAAANAAAAQNQLGTIALPFSNYQGTIATMLAPFPQYAGAIAGGTGAGGTTCYSCNEGSSSYNSMQVTVQRQFAQGFTTQFAYTWAKELDNLSGMRVSWELSLAEPEIRSIRLRIAARRNRPSP